MRESQGLDATGLGMGENALVYVFVPPGFLAIRSSIGNGARLLL